MRRSFPEPRVGVDSDVGEDVPPAGTMRLEYVSIEQIRGRPLGFMATCHYRAEKRAFLEARTLLGWAKCPSEVVGVKMAGSGAILLRMRPELDASKLLELFEKIVDGVREGSVPPPRHCQRFVPVQDCCGSDEASLRTSIVSLVRCYGSDVERFACVLRRRGDVSFSRQGTLEALGRAVCEVLPNARVDLRHPQRVLLVEVLPLGGGTLLSLSWVDARHCEHGRVLAAARLTSVHTSTPVA